MAWSPTLTDNGWFPKLSPTGQYVAFGTREVWLAELSGPDTAEGGEILIGPDPALGHDVWGSGGTNLRWYVVGWLSETELLYVRGSFAGETISGGFTFWLYDTDAMTSTEQVALGTYADLSDFDARNGHWIASLAGSPSRVWIDGTELTAPGGWDVSIDGDDAIISGYAPGGPTCWHDAVVTAVHPIHEENTGWVREGVFTAKLQNGRCVMWALAAPTLVDITNVPVGIGYTNTLHCHGWYFQILEHVGAADETMLQYYASGQAPIRVARPLGSQGWLDVIYDPTTMLFVVATLHDGGVMVIDWVAGGDTAVVTITYTDPPPLQQFVIDPKSGQATRPWSVWFEAQRRHTSTHPYGYVSDNVILGRATGTFGPAYPLGIGTGMTTTSGNLTADPSTFILRGLRIDQPLATAVLTGTLYNVTDEGIIERSNGTTWELFG